MRNDQLCKCGRCRDVHRYDERVWVARKTPDVRDLCCPKCSGKVYYKQLTPTESCTR